MTAVERPPGPVAPAAFGLDRFRACLGGSFLPAELTVIALLLWIWGVGRVELAAMSDAGLASVLGWPVLLSYAVLAAASVLALRSPEVPGRLLGAQAVLLVFMVHGLPAVLEPQAGYFSAYLHVGFVEEITRTGRTLPSLDARFSWPGSFGLGALVAAVGGVDGATYYLRWAPVVFNVAYLAPLRMIAKTFTTDERVRWLAVWMFVAANWVHQDYYSPQAVALFVYMVVLAIVLRWFGAGRTVGGDHPRRFAAARLARFDELRAGWVRADHAAGETLVADRRTTGLLVGILVLLLATLVASHQLTPVAALLVLTALVVVGRCSLRHLPMVAALLFAGWFAVGATGYWLGHLSTLTGGAGEVGQNLSSSLLGRVGGSSARVWVLRLRIGLSLVMLAAAAGGALRRWRHGAPPLAMAAVLAPPFLLVGGQSYGGEVLLRSYLFALPAICLLTAFALAGGGSHRHRWWLAVAGVVLTAMALTGVTARFGNEQFEQVGTDDLAAVGWVYDHVPTGTVLIAPTRNLPWRSRQLETYRYKPDDEFPLTTVRDVTRFVRRDQPAYLLVSEKQQLFGQQLYALEPHWLDHLVAELEATGRLRTAFRSHDAAVYEISPRGAG